MTWIAPSIRKLKCDRCGTEVIAGGPIPDGWAGLHTYGNDGGGPGQIMNSWHFCPDCSERVIEMAQHDESVAGAVNDD